MLHEHTYRTSAEARAFLDGLSERFDESVLIIGLRQTQAAPDEFVAAFVDEGREDYTPEMRQIFSPEELEQELRGEEIVKRYLERFPQTEEFNDSVAPAEDRGPETHVQTGAPPQVQVAVETATCPECNRPLLNEAGESTYCGSVHSTECYQNHLRHCPLCDENNSYH